MRLPGAGRRAVARPWRRVLRQGSGGCPQPWRRSYTCLKGAPYDGCGRISRWADPAEELTSEMVIHELAGPGLSDALRRRVGDDSDHDGSVTDLAEDEAAIAQLAADHYSARLISRAEYLAARSARGQDHRHQAGAGSPTRGRRTGGPASGRGGASNGVGGGVGRLAPSRVGRCLRALWSAPLSGTEPLRRSPHPSHLARIASRLPRLLLPTAIRPDGRGAMATGPQQQLAPVCTAPSRRRRRCRCGSPGRLRVMAAGPCPPRSWAADGEHREEGDGEGGDRRA